MDTAYARLLVMPYERFCSHCYAVPEQVLRDKRAVI